MTTNQTISTENTYKLIGYSTALTNLMTELIKLNYVNDGKYFKKEIKQWTNQFIKSYESYIDEFDENVYDVSQEVLNRTDASYVYLKYNLVMGNTIKINKINQVFEQLRKGNKVTDSIVSKVFKQVVTKTKTDFIFYDKYVIHNTYLSLLLVKEIKNSCKQVDGKVFFTSHFTNIINKGIDIFEREILKDKSKVDVIKYYKDMTNIIGGMDALNFSLTTETSMALNYNEKAILNTFK